MFAPLDAIHIVSGTSYCNSHYRQRMHLVREDGHEHSLRCDVAVRTVASNIRVSVSYILAMGIGLAVAVRSL